MRTESANHNNDDSNTVTASRSSTKVANGDGWSELRPFFEQTDAKTALSNNNVVNNSEYAAELSFIR